MTDYPKRKHSAVMRAHLTLKDARVADVGCGDGALARFMTRESAAVIGIEPGPAQLAKARTAAPAGDERYVMGLAEALPLRDASLDIVVLFNSLHHVPVALQRAALDEAARVLVPGGWLFIMEPLAEGPYFELTRPIEDETAVRAAAYEAIQDALANGAVRAETEERYSAPFKYASFAVMKASALAIDPQRRNAFAAHEAALAQGFEALGEQRDGAYWFEQPSRLNLLQRA